MSPHPVDQQVTLWRFTSGGAMQTGSTESKNTMRDFSWTRAMSPPTGWYTSYVGCTITLFTSNHWVWLPANLRSTRPTYISNASMLLSLWGQRTKAQWLEHLAPGKQGDSPFTGPGRPAAWWPQSPGSQPGYGKASFWHTENLAVWQNCPQRSPDPGQSRIQGLIMTCWSPTAQEGGLVRCTVSRLWR